MIDFQFQGFVKTNPQLFFSKKDPQDLRYGDIVQRPDAGHLPMINTFVLRGYSDHEGIELNGGRSGSALAPDQIRQFFYKMTPFELRDGESLCLKDAGNIDGTKNTLAARHELALKACLETLLAGATPLCLGGGHDYGYPDAAGFLEYHLQKSMTPSEAAGVRPLVINFDAHLDVRPVVQDFHSGTPFRRLLEKYHGKFEFIEVGIQPQCNSSHHLQWARSQGAHLIGIEKIEAYGLKNCLAQVIEKIYPQVRPPTWLSIDIDGFSQSEAPGCSQSWVRGFSFKDFLPCMESIHSLTQVSGMGIYEVSPPLDVDHRTSKLAALLLYSFIQNHLKSHQGA